MSTDPDEAVVSELSLGELAALLEEYLPSYEPLNSSFSGHNRFAELVRELLRRQGEET